MGGRGCAQAVAMILELRQYTCHPGRRDELIALFEGELLAPQRAAGMEMVGQFRDADDQDRFVWMRAFADHEARRVACEAFYDGPVWREHRDAANATMIDSSNVLLLEPAGPGPGMVPDGRLGPIVATIFALETPVDEAFRRGVADGRTALGCFVSAPGVSTFPRHPVRVGEHVLVCFAREAARLPAGLTRRLVAPAQELRLVATAGSALR
jgi:hypothetical protein